MSETLIRELETMAINSTKSYTGVDSVDLNEFVINETSKIASRYGNRLSHSYYMLIKQTIIRILGNQSNNLPG
jgi:macrodomain Ter protein organizer (MatP/YcbG family)